MSGCIAKSDLINGSQGVLATKTPTVFNFCDELVCEQAFIAVQQASKPARKILVDIIKLLFCQISNKRLKAISKLHEIA